MASAAAEDPRPADTVRSADVKEAAAAPAANRMPVARAEEAAEDATGVAASVICVVRAALELALAKLDVNALISVASWAELAAPAEAAALTLISVVRLAVSAVDNAETDADIKAPTWSVAVGTEAVATAAAEKFIAVVSWAVDDAPETADA